MFHLSHSAKVKVEILFILSLLGLAGYSLAVRGILFRTSTMVDFGIQYHWAEDHLHAPLASDLSQPVVVVVGNVHYVGDTMQGNGGYCQGFEALPAQLGDIEILETTDDTCALTILGTSKTLSKGERWQIQVQKIQYLSEYEAEFLFSYSTTVHHMGVTDTVTYNYEPEWMELQFDQTFPVLEIITYLHTQPTFPPILFNNLAIQLICAMLLCLAILNGYSIITNRNQRL